MSSEFMPWLVLALVVGVMLAFDLLVLHREAKPVPLRQAAAWSLVWVSLALGFGVFVTGVRGTDAGAEYLAAYLIELSLSVDNIFVFALIFTAFAVPAAYQHRLLFWGILGAIVFRALFIGAGTAILASAHWVIYILGLLLVFTGIRLARSRGHAVDPEKNPVLRLFRRVFPTTDDYRGAAFVVREGGRRLATPLLAALVVVETTDIMFALDSIPAVFSITADPFVVFSSNLFAILGLRSMYFLLAGVLDRFIYLKVGLAVLLVFAGVKILLSDFYKIPIWASLLVIVGVLATAVIVSLVATHPRRAAWRESPIVGAAIRAAAGVAFGLAGLGFVAVVAALRDGVAWPASVAVAVAALLLGVVALRGLRIRPALVRAWATAGATILLVVALFFALD